MSSPNFFAELKRRNVYKVAVAYAVVSWLLIQAASIFLPAFDAPAWSMKTIILVLILGFPVALVLSWAFEITPEGIKRESEIASNKSIARKTGRKIAAITTVLAIIAAGLFVFQILRSKNTSTPRSASDELRRDNQSEGAPNPIQNKSIAVLPFDNLSEDKSNAYFAEGVQDEILTRLAKVADLKVISRTSTQRFKSAPTDLREIAKQLGVMNVLEGSVQKANDQVRVNVQLINAMSDAHLWADTFDRKLTDIFAVETEIAHTIADTLQAKLSGSEKMMMSKKPTANGEAYELYLKGRFFWNKRTPEDLTKSVEYFNQAIAMDPNYALAYAGVADAYVLYPDYGLGTPAEFNPKAKEMALKALSLEPSLGAPHAALGGVYTNMDRDFPKAIAEFERAIELDPNYATAHQWFTTPLGATLQFDRAIAEDKKAVELDPLSLIVNSDLAFNYVNAQRFDEAEAQARKTLEIDPGFHVARGYLGLALQFKGRLKEALPEFRAGASEPFSQGLLGQACARAGLRDEAQTILARLEEQARTKFVSGYSIAMIRLALGDKDGAIAALETAAEQHASEILLLQSDPLFNDLRGDTRFEALIRQIFGPKP
jgi:serine/threonine-protein kinase